MQRPLSRFHHIIEGLSEWLGILWFRRFLRFRRSLWFSRRWRLRHGITEILQQVSHAIILYAIDPLPHHITSVTFVLSKVDRRDEAQHIPRSPKVLFHNLFFSALTVPATGARATGIKCLWTTGYLLHYHFGLPCSLICSVNSISTVTIHPSIISHSLL